MRSEKRLSDGQLKDLSRKMLNLRACSGLTQRDLAKEMGVHRHTVMNVENRSHVCFPGTYRKFLEAEARLARKAKRELDAVRNAPWGPED